MIDKEERNRLKHFEAQIAARKNNGVKAASSCHKSGIVRRETKQYLSRAGTGGTERVDRQYYTGKNLVGIGTLHKSNLVPVFKEQDAKDIGAMRR